MIKEELSRNHQIKQYICHYFCQEPVSVRHARGGAEAKGLKKIHVPENVGRILQLLTHLQAPQRVLEVGTLAGYSSLWIAEALNSGAHMITLEVDEEHAAIAKEHLQQGGFQDQVEVRLGKAEDLMHCMIVDQCLPFDLIFIDADKEKYSSYLELAIQLSRPGTLILCDNMIPKRGPIGAPDPQDHEAVGIYICNQQLSHHPRLDVFFMPTLVGEKGRLDALAIAIVKN